MTRYLFRNPDFPVLIETDQGIYGAEDTTTLFKFIEKATFNENKEYLVITGAGKEWHYFPDYDIVQPFMSNKIVSKKRIIGIVNDDLARRGIEAQYISGSLAHKQVKTVMEELVAFLKRHS